MYNKIYKFISKNNIICSLLSQDSPQVTGKWIVPLRIDPFSTIFFQLITDPWMIHLLKCLNQLCWIPNKVWSIIGLYQANIPFMTNESS